MGYRERVAGVTRHAIARHSPPPSLPCDRRRPSERELVHGASLRPSSPLRYSCLVSPSIKAPFVSLDFSHLQQCFPSLLLLLLLHVLLSPCSPTRCRSSLTLHAVLRYYHLRLPPAFSSPKQNNFSFAEENAVNPPEDGRVYVQRASCPPLSQHRCKCTISGI